MIVKAQAILDKAELAQHAETNKLTLRTARSIHIQGLEAEKGSELEEARTHLAETVSIDIEELKQQTIARVEENKKNKLSSLKAKL